LLDQTKRMFQWWHRVRDGTLKRSSFREYMRPVRRSVEYLLREGASSGAGMMSGSCRKMLKLASALWTFVRVKGVEPTNNAAERAIRPGVLWRKGSFGTDSARGSRFVERIMTVAAACRQQGRNVLDYVTRARQATLRGELAPSLLPESMASPMSAAAWGLNAYAAPLTFGEQQAGRRKDRGHDRAEGAFVSPEAGCQRVASCQGANPSHAVGVHVPIPQVARNRNMSQTGNTRTMIFSVPDLIAFATRGMTLMPGDILSTGTYPGVSAFRDPPMFLTDGDIVEAEITNLGRQRLRAVGEKLPG
jgi:hypothetical protein